MPPLPRPVAACAAAGLFLLAAVPFARRAAGAVTADLRPGEACLLSALVTWAAVAACEPWPLPRGVRRALPFLIGVTCAAGLVGEPLALLACLFPVTALSAAPLLGDLFSHAPAHAVPIQPEASEPSDAAPFIPPAADPNLELRRDGDRLTGRLTFQVPADETLRTLHVPLWPPLEFDPHVSCELDGIEGRVRVTLAKRYGLRLEVRLAEACDEPLSGAVRFTAEPLAAAA